MRHADEINHAHDRLAEILRECRQSDFAGPADHQAMRAALSALCWVLEHQVARDYLGHGTTHH